MISNICCSNSESLPGNFLENLRVMRGFFACGNKLNKCAGNFIQMYVPTGNRCEKLVRCRGTITGPAFSERKKKQLNCTSILQD